MFKKSFCVLGLLGLLQCGAPETEVVVPQTAVVVDAESCNQTQSKSECSEFTGIAKTVAKTLCVEGTHSTQACPAGFVGKCNTGKGIAKVYYKTGHIPYTAASAKTDCENMEGEFLP